MPKCSSTGRNCDGYNPYPLVGKPSGRFIPQISSDVQERRLFHLFRISTSVQFSGEFESSFWSRLLLQACQVSPALRHGATALGSLHEGFMVGPGRTQHPVRNNAIYALCQYTKALEEMRKSLESKDQPIVVTLMSCILFSCFESLQGQLQSAVVHLRSGLEILQSSRLPIDSSSDASETVINETILSEFSRLGFQANYFIDKTHLANQIQLFSQQGSLSARRSKRISSLEDAQARLYACLNGTMFSGWRENQPKDSGSFSTQYNITRCAQLIIKGERSVEFDIGRKNALSALEEWEFSFKDFFQAREMFMTSRDIKGSTLLKLHHLVAILLLTKADGTSPNERYNSKSALHGFKKIIEWSKFLRATDQPGMNGMTSAFSPHVGIIAPMFFVATQCPDRDLRVEAKEILASGPRLEGMWDADVAVKIIEDLNI